MLQLSHYTFELAFQYPFTIAKGTKTHQPTLVVSLGLGSLRGFGEASAIHYYNVTTESMVQALEAKRPVIERYALIDPQRFWHFLHHLLPGENFLIAALDIASWDLFTQLRRIPLRKYLNIVTDTIPATDYTIGLDDIPTMVSKLQAHPWTCYKIKIGSADDLDKIRSLRVHTDKPLRVDANESLSYEDTRRLLPELKALGVTLLEQPLSRQEWSAMEALKQESALPLIADESCVEEKDVAECARAFHGINIKLTKCGGITPALRMIEHARKLNMQVMLGSMNESTIGTAAVAQIAPLADFIDADGPLLLAEDIADGLHFEDGQLISPHVPGLGIHFWGTPKRIR